LNKEITMMTNGADPETALQKKRTEKVQGSCTLPEDDEEEDVGSINSHSLSDGDDDNDNDPDDQSSVTNSVYHTKVSELEHERKTLARQENKAVRLLRVLVFVVLSSTAAVVAMGVHRYISHDQHSNFETDFEAHAAKLLESFHDSVERKLEAVDALAVTITSHAIQSGSSWPNVTLPDFAVRVANTRILADAVVVNFYPLVTDDTRAGWEAYYNANRFRYTIEFEQDQRQQVLQDARFNETSDNTGDGSSKEGGATRQLQQGASATGPIEFDMLGFPISKSIFNLQDDGFTTPAPENSGPYLPVWQVSPVVPMQSLLNFNALSHPAGKGAYEELIRSEQPVLGMADNLNQEHFGNTGIYFKLLLSMSQYRGAMNRFLGEPISALGYPVFDSLDPTTRHLTGAIATNIYWRVNFQNVLPPNAKGIICVISNTLNQTFTYRVDGEEPTFLGNGDLHDPHYDDMVQSANVFTYLKAKKSIETRSYSSVDLNEEYCSYSLHIYPSHDMEDQFINNDPLMFTLVVVFVFCFTSVVFILYDCIVARRQRIVMDRALASSAIVASLFPSQVRQQLYDESKDQQQQAAKVHEQARRPPLDMWKVDRQASIRGGILSGAGTTSTSTTITQAASTYTKPMASLFQNTTILFADMAGFTAWSATRTPEQVFELLERVYSALDEIADRRKVFKVETIGDCYVAVVCFNFVSSCVPPFRRFLFSSPLFCVLGQTGLPEPQDDHAILMVKFARDIMSKMRNVTRDLVATMGEDTAELQMRVGLHSGSVTGTHTCLQS
jgi:class 3 adenylate cyclase